MVKWTTLNEFPEILKTASEPPFPLSFFFMNRRLGVANLLQGFPNVSWILPMTLNTASTQFSPPFAPVCTLHLLSSFALLRAIHPWLGRPPLADYRRVLVAPGAPISLGPDLLDNQIRTSDLFRAMFNTLNTMTRIRLKKGPSDGYLEKDSTEKKNPNFRGVAA